MKKSKIKKFIFLPHTADVKFQAYGKTLNEVYENSALATIHVIYDGKKKVLNKKIKKLKVKGKDLNELMYNFLDEIIYLVDAENFLIGSLKVRVDEKKGILNADLYGDDVKKYKELDSVKSVTYSEMFVRKDPRLGKWKAQVVLDI